MIQISSALPAAQAGNVLCTWQTSANGRTSVQVIFGATVKTSLSSLFGVLTLDASIANSFLINVLEDITSMSIINPTDGEEITLLWSQDGTGHAVTVATNLLGPGTVSTGANAQSCYRYTFNSADGNWYQIGANGM